MDFENLPFDEKNDELEDTLPFEPIDELKKETTVPKDSIQKQTVEVNDKTEYSLEENDNFSNPFESISKTGNINSEVNNSSFENNAINEENIFQSNINALDTKKESYTRDELPVLSRPLSNKKMEKIMNIMPVFAFIFVSILGIYIFSLNVKAEQVNLIKIEENNKFGYINKDGEVLVKPKYISGTDFYKGYAIVENYNNLSGILNGEAKLEVPFGNYFYIDLYKNRYIVSKFTENGLKQGLLNSNLEELTRFNYDSISYSRTGLFLFTRDETMGIMNSNGKEIYTYEVDEVDDRNISIEVSDITNSKPKYARIKINSSSTIVNIETGLEVYKYTLNDIYVLDNNVFYTKTKDGNNKYIIINDDKVVYETSSYKRVRVEDVNSDIAIGITDNAEYDYINLNTREVINSNENISYNYSDGIVLIEKHNFNTDDDEYSIYTPDKTLGTFKNIKTVDNTFVNGYSKIYTDNNKYNFINKKGKIISDKEYDNVSDFSESGYAIVINNNEYGLINTSGKETISTKYDEIVMFDDDFFNMIYNKTNEELFIFRINDKYGIIDSKGKIVIKPIYDSIETISSKYPILSAKYNKEDLLINLENKKELTMDLRDDINIYNDYIIIDKYYYNYDGKLIYSSK